MGKLVKVYLGWDKGEAPSGSHILMKRLSGVGLHTYVGMLEYCIKDKGEDHFEVVHNSITDEDLIAGLEEYVEKYFQVVFRILSISTIAMGKLVKVYLRWDKGEAPSGSHVLVKRLSGVGLHTYVGMLGYCIKDKGEDHFEVVHNNITDEDLIAGLEEYVKFGTPFAKNKVVLTSKNLLERCLCYLQYRMKSQLGSTLPGVLLHMLRSGTYIPDAQWVIPRTCGGMDYVRAAAM